jgi:hypothetical protein
MTLTQITNRREQMSNHDRFGLPIITDYPPTPPVKPPRISVAEADARMAEKDARIKELEAEIVALNRKCNQLNGALLSCYNSAKPFINEL